MPRKHRRAGDRHEEHGGRFPRLRPHSSPQLEGLDLNRLVAEVLALYEQSGTRSRPTSREHSAGARDPDRLRQVIHNLLQNAQDALSGSSDPKSKSRRSFPVGRSAANQRQRLRFPEAIINGAFEPYVTTKPKGTDSGSRSSNASSTSTRALSG